MTASANGVALELPVCCYREKTPLTVWRCQHPSVLFTNETRCMVCPHASATLRTPPVLDPPKPLPVIPVVKTSQPSPPPQKRLSRRERRLAERHKEIGIDQPLGLIINRTGKPVDIANLFWDADLFVVLPGPSLAKLPLDQLNRRGVVTFGVNNVAATAYRPDIWTCVDPVCKMHCNIWRDPGIMKFMPDGKFREVILDQTEDGEFVQTDQHPHHLPNVFGYRRNTFFDPAKFLTEPTCNWGNTKKGADKGNPQGNPKYPYTLNVMMAMFRLSFYLGFRRLFLLGCDFNMTAQRPYCFDEQKAGDGVGPANSNNNAYAAVTAFLTALKPYFDKEKFQVYNCNPDSHLRIFDHVPFEDALAESTKRIIKNASTVGWYAKDFAKKKK